MWQIMRKGKTWQKSNTLTQKIKTSNYVFRNFFNLIKSGATKLFSLRAGLLRD